MSEPSYDDVRSQNATQKQVKFITDLLDERNRSTYLFIPQDLPRIVGRRVTFLHELTRSEASECIKWLLETKEAQ